MLQCHTHFDEIAYDTSNVGAELFSPARLIETMFFLKSVTPHSSLLIVHYESIPTHSVLLPMYLRILRMEYHNPLQRPHTFLGFEGLVHL